MTDRIEAKASLKDEVVTATLTLGEATLTLSCPQRSEEAWADMANLVVQSEESFAVVLEALAAKAERVDS